MHSIACSCNTWNGPSSNAAWLKANHKKSGVNYCVCHLGSNIPRGEDLLWQISSLPA